MLLTNMQGHGHHPVCFCKKSIHYKHLNECTCCTAGLLHCMTSNLIAHDFAVVRPGDKNTGSNCIGLFLNNTPLMHALHIVPT